MKISQVSRRTLLMRAAVLTAVSLPVSRLLSSNAYAYGDKPPLPERLKRVLTGEISRNGWEMERVVDNGGSIYTRPVPGTPLKGVAVRMGDGEEVLVHVIRRFHYEIDQLRPGDVIGWRSPSAVRKSLAESNQASGTAVQIRPGHYPKGARGGFFPQEQLVIRDILAELDGVVRWGGDDRRSDEALFYIDVKPGDPRLAKVVQKIRVWKDSPGEGAGAGVDVFSAKRRNAAKALRRRQRPS